MFSITNEKVAGFVPRWAEFRGFSILFDSPGNCLTPYHQHLDLTCDVDDDPELSFYRNLRDNLARLNVDLLTTTYSFCPLPPQSYHVTAWDGGNYGNISQVIQEQRPKMENYFQDLPEGVNSAYDFTEMALVSPLIHRRDWNITFEFSEMAIWGSVAMVARLTPTEASRNEFDLFVAERRRLNASFRQAFGIGASENFTPHVSLGYFANREGAQLAMPRLHEWNRLFAEQMEGLNLSFAHASLYGFTDMAKFFTFAALR